MKKRLLILGMIACMLGLTACGSESGPAVLTEEEQNASQVATQYVEQLAMIVDQGYAEEVIAQDETMEATIDGWNNAMELLGGYERFQHFVQIPDGGHVPLARGRKSVLRSHGRKPSCASRRRA